MKVFRRVTDATGAPLALTDVFRFPTVRTFAEHLDQARSAATAGAGGPPTPPTGSDRGARRRQALARRGGGEPER